MTLALHRSRSEFLPLRAYPGQSDAPWVTGNPLVGPAKLSDDVLGAGETVRTSFLAAALIEVKIGA